MNIYFVWSENTSYYGVNSIVYANNENEALELAKKKWQYVRDDTIYTVELIGVTIDTCLKPQVFYSDFGDG